MLKPGLVSITFRQLSPSELVALAKDAGLGGIEWGGDVHVPPGDLQRAAEVRRLTEDAGLSVAAYGSYYRLGQEDGPPFESVLDTAVALGAPSIRVWAGNTGTAQAKDEDRQRVADASWRVAEAAAQAGLLVAYEFHGGTLTDTPASTRALLEGAAHPALRTLWQPRYWDENESVESNVESLHEVLPWLLNLHVYHWVGRNGQREKRPLEEGADDWRAYLGAVGDSDGWALLEFVRDDAPEVLRGDAAALRVWLNGVGTQ